MITIHIGLLKTGTTSLQNSIFHKTEDVQFLGKSTKILNLVRDSKNVNLFSSFEKYLYNEKEKHLVNQGINTIRNLKTSNSPIGELDVFKKV